MSEQESIKATNAFTSVISLTKKGVHSLPQRYVLPPPQRPGITSHENMKISLPIIDISSLHNPTLRSQTINEVGLACKNLGFFQVVNHGIPTSVLNDALAAASEFFDLPDDEKMSLASPDVLQPVRFGTSLNQAKDKIYYWRDFIKHYSHPLSKWIDFWPSNPPSYRSKMGCYAESIQMLHKELIQVVFESLRLDVDYLRDEVEGSSQLFAVNCYPSCPEPDLSLGLPPHSDYGTLTILLQNHQGLEIMDHCKNWHLVPVIDGALVVQLGDQLEIMSNGNYKSIIHRAILNASITRISIASLHSLGLGTKVRPATELVDEKEGPAYEEACFEDFLNFISHIDITEKRYIDTLKKEYCMQK